MPIAAASSASEFSREILRIAPFVRRLRKLTNTSVLGALVFAAMVADTPFAQTYTRVDAGLAHSCAVLSSGGVNCWGFGGSGRLGQGSTENSLTPVPVVGLLDATAVEAGAGHSCALSQGGAVWCWGSSGNGQLGNGSNAASAVPVSVSLPAGMVATGISSRGFFTCAVMQGGPVRCWGSGALGNGSNSDSNVPVGVNLAVGDFAVEVSAGNDHACARLSNGNLRCWGSNTSGQLGNGMTNSSNVPVSVQLFGDLATTISAGSGHTCAVLASGSVGCWGRGLEGQLGNGGTSSSSSLVSVSGLSAAATAVVAGNQFTCALLATKRIECWGLGTSGQLGNSAASSSSTPVQVANITDAVAITAGEQHACAVLASGAVQCWGSNAGGRLGDGTTVSRTTPRFISQSCNMDLDANGVQSALTDALIYQRALLGLSGLAVTNNVLGANAKRTSWEELRGYLTEVCGATGLAP
ncbi:MAG: RCC1 domain-containing protein [Casimicrobium sp.]